MTAPRRLIDDCFLHDSDRLRHHDVLALLKERLAPVCGTQRVPLPELGGRILAAELTATRNVPPTDNAAVDGYAFAHGDYLASNGRLTVTQRIAAGHPGTALGPGEAARIFTGAVMPSGADTVAMQEDCESDGSVVAIPAGLKSGANRRAAGEDVSAGTGLVSTGTRLRPQDIAAIAAQGLAAVLCFEPLRIGLFSTGDEIAEPGETAKEGRIFDSNRVMLSTLLANWPCTVTDCGRLPDRRDAVAAGLDEAARRFDLVITTGGASRGEEDHVVDVLSEIGKRHIWQLAIKPGRPLMVGQKGDTVFFGLPGNPVAVFVCALLYLRPAIFRLAGGRWPEPSAFNLPAAFQMKKKPGRREFLRGIPVVEDGIAIAVDKFARDGSGLITGLRQSAGLIEIAEDTTSVVPGDPVRFLPYAEFGLG